jgi:glycerol uptake facilitator protein
MSTTGATRLACGKPSPTLGVQCLGETVGTFILVFVGVGSVHSAVITGAMSGIWQVAVVWGIGVSLAIYVSSAMSGAHLNPAITVALAAFRGFAWRNVVPYILSQLVGAILAACLLYVLFHGPIASFELAKGLVRGNPGSELSAMVYGEYFPNPAIAASSPGIVGLSVFAAMLAETVGTAILALIVFAVTDEHNTGRPDKRLAPLFIGLTVSVLIAILAPISQAGFNPARDFGPRLVAYMAGWGSVAIPGPSGGFFTVYILSPIVGALIGAAAYKYIVSKALLAVNPQEERCESTSDLEYLPEPIPVSRTNA